MKQKHGSTGGGTGPAVEMPADAAVVVPQAAEVRVVMRAVKVPLLERTGPAEGEGYNARHIDVHLPAGAARTFARIRRALQRQHAQLQNGRHVDSPGETLRWLLERLEDGGEKQ